MSRPHALHIIDEPSRIALAYPGGMRVNADGEVDTFTGDASKFIIDPASVALVESALVELPSVRESLKAAQKSVAERLAECGRLQTLAKGHESHIRTLEEALAEAGAELLTTRDERDVARGQLMESRRISEERHADLQALAQKLGCDPTREAMVWAIDGLRADMDNLDASHVTERETFARLLAEDRSTRSTLIYAALIGWGLAAALGAVLVLA